MTHEFVPRGTASSAFREVSLSTKLPGFASLLFPAAYLKNKQSRLPALEAQLQLS